MQLPCILTILKSECVLNEALKKLLVPGKTIDLQLPERRHWLSVLPLERVTTGYYVWTDEGSRKSGRGDLEAEPRGEWAVAGVQGEHAGHRFGGDEVAWWLQGTVNLSFVSISVQRKAKPWK